MIEQIEVIVEVIEGMSICILLLLLLLVSIR